MYFAVLICILVDFSKTEELLFYCQVMNRYCSSCHGSELELNKQVKYIVIILNQILTESYCCFLLLLITCFLFLFLIFSFLVYFSFVFSCENRPVPFPGQMSSKATKPGL